MTRIIGIGGLPATGKSTLMKAVLAYLGKGKRFKYGLLRGTNYNGIYVLGLYADDTVFPGTDCLSMAVMGDAIKFIEQMHNKAKCIIFEGDRLFSAKFLKAIQTFTTDAYFFVLTAEKNILEFRHMQRDNQNRSWLAGRATKINNLILDYPITTLNNNDEHDMKNNIDLLLKIIPLI